jgi:hypothetical protein
LEGAAASRPPGDNADFIGALEVLETVTEPEGTQEMDDVVARWTTALPVVKLIGSSFVSGLRSALALVAGAPASAQLLAAPGADAPACTEGRAMSAPAPGPVGGALPRLRSASGDAPGMVPSRRLSHWTLTLCAGGAAGKQRARSDEEGGA